MAKKALKKKHAYKKECHQMAKGGKINSADGKWISRAQAPDNSMKRDFMPNR